MLIVIIQNALLLIVRRLSKIFAMVVADICDGRRKLWVSSCWKIKGGYHDDCFSIYATYYIVANCGI